MDFNKKDLGTVPNKNNPTMSSTKRTFGRLFLLILKKCFSHIPMPYNLYDISMTKFSEFNLVIDYKLKFMEAVEVNLSCKVPSDGIFYERFFQMGSNSSK